MSAYLESGPGANRSGLVSLAEAAQRLGYHVETLRLRVRQGRLAARRGPHGAYLISESALAAIPPPTRFARRAFGPEILESSWRLWARTTEAQSLSQGQIESLAFLRQDPGLSKSLTRLFGVQRLRSAGLNSTEIADLLGISPRHVRRLSERHLKGNIERNRSRDPDGWELDDDDGDDPYEFLFIALKRKIERQSRAVARRVVRRVQRRLQAEGFRYHERHRPDDAFVPSDRPAPAFLVTTLIREVRSHLIDAGLTELELAAIRVAGIGEDELNELVLRGLSAAAQRAANQGS